MTNCKETPKPDKKPCGCKHENQNNDAYNDKYMNGHERQAPKDPATCNLHDDPGFHKDFNHYDRKG